MKNLVIIFSLFLCVFISINAYSQGISIKSVYTEKKCDELIHRLSDSLMLITGDVSKNFLKINEMTNRVTHQFVTEFEKDLGKPIKGEDYKYLIQQSRNCINEPSKSAEANLCGNCSGSGYRICDYCHGRASEPCKICSATGTIFSNGNRISCVACQSTGYRNCLKCNGRGDLRCNTCNGTGHVK